MVGRTREEAQVNLLQIDLGAPSLWLIGEEFCKKKMAVEGTIFRVMILDMYPCLYLSTCLLPRSFLGLSTELQIPVCIVEAVKSAAFLQRMAEVKDLPISRVFNSVKPKSLYKTFYF